MVTSSLVVVVCLALLFDYTNGFHDAANSIATIVSTKVLTPFQAVLWAATFNFIVFFFIKDHKVANTVSKIVVEHFVTIHVLLAGLIAAITWNLITWWFGIPSSSSHTLIGGFAGAGITNGIYMGVNGLTAVNLKLVLTTIAYIVVAPVLGLLLGYIVTIIILWICRKARPSSAERWFKRGQLVSSA